jgi:hypothetical protein
MNTHLLNWLIAGSTFRVSQNPRNGGAESALIRWLIVGKSLKIQGKSRAMRMQKFFYFLLLQRGARLFGGQIL